MHVVKHIKPGIVVVAMLLRRRLRALALLVIGSICPAFLEQIFNRFVDSCPEIEQLKKSSPWTHISSTQFHSDFGNSM